MKDFELFVKRLESGVNVNDTLETICVELGLECRNIGVLTEQILGTDANKLVECYKFDIPLPFL